MNWTYHLSHLCAVEGGEGRCYLNLAGSWLEGEKKKRRGSLFCKGS